MAVEPLSQSKNIKIASWNVNSLRVRVTHLIKWIKINNPDVILLQELKAREEFLPREEIEDLGYNFIAKGQKSYNGVAILSKFPLSDISYSLPTLESDNQARYIEAWVEAEKGFRVASVYVPNGNPVDSDKFTYKIEWIKKFINHSINLIKNNEPIILGGDFNICPDHIDAATPEKLTNDAVFMPEIKSLFKHMLNLGFIDAYRTFNEDNKEFTYWDYGSAFEANLGLRIDHFLLSSLVADRCTKVYIDRDPRGWPRPSDHTPIICLIDV